MKTKTFIIGIILVFYSSFTYCQKKYFRAIAKNDIEMFMAELKKGSDINHTRWLEGDSPLIFATKQGKLQFVRILIKNHCDLNITDIAGRSALIYAIMFRHTDIVSLLINEGADVSIKDTGGKSGIHYSCMPSITNVDSTFHSQRIIIEDLLSSGVSINDSTSKDITPVIIASKNGNLKLVKFLIDKGADINRKPISHNHVGIPIEIKKLHNLKEINTDKITPLGQAVTYGHLEVIKLLLDSGADIDTKCQAECTPLMLAILNQKYDIADTLIKRNADINYVNNEGFSALKFAIVNGNRNLAERLYEKQQFKIDLDNKYHNGLVTTSIVHMPVFFKTLSTNEKYFWEAGKNKMLFDSLQSKEEYALKYIENLEKSRQCYDKREKEYREIADKMAAKNALNVIGSLAATIAVNSLVPSETVFSTVTPGIMYKPKDFYTIADKYKAQISYLTGLIEFERKRL